MSVTLWQTNLPSHPATITTEVLESQPALLDSLLQETQSAQSTRRLLIMFPGNPGIVYFYTSFVEMLTQQGFDVLVVGFAGHSIVDVNQGRYFQLQDQVEFIDAFLHAVLPKAEKVYGQGCYLGGHSIGAWMATQMAARFPVIKKAFLLTPTICNMRQSPNGSKNTKYLKTWLISLFTSTVVPLAGMLPSSIFQKLLSLTQRELDENGAWVAETMTRKPMMQNMLMLAQSEFEQVATLDVALLHSIGPNRLVFYFVKKDGWVPMSDVALITDAVKDMEQTVVVVEEDENVPHAWCLKFNKEVIERGIIPFV